MTFLVRKIIGENVDVMYVVVVGLPSSLSDVTSKLGEGPSAIVSSVQEKCSLMWIAIAKFFAFRSLAGISLKFL